MKKYLFFFICIGIMSSLFLGLTETVSAELKPYIPLTDLPIFETDASGAVQNPGSLVSRIYTLSIGIGSLLAVIVITVSGIQYMISEAFTVKIDAKKRIWAALGGLILLLSSYLILRTINKALVGQEINLSTSGGSSSAPERYCYTSVTGTKKCGATAAECEAYRKQDLDKGHTLINACKKE